MRRGNPTWILRTTLSLIVALAGQAASATDRSQAAPDMDDVRAGSVALVLLRISGAVDGKTITKLGSPASNTALQVYLANLDRLDVPEQVRAASFSKELASAGWYYWLLPPGTYHMLPIPPGASQNPPAIAYHAPSGRYGRLTQYKFEPGRGAFWSSPLMSYVFAGEAPPDFEALSGYWFQVPSGGSVVYLGSLSIACRGGRGLFGSLIDSCTDYELASELAAALGIVGKSAPELAVEARPLTPYGEPRAGVRLRDLGSASVVASPPSAVAATGGDAELGPTAIIPGVGDAVVVYNLLAATFELAARATEKHRAEEAAARLEPCMDQLAASLDAADFRSRFIEALEQAFASRGATLDFDASSGDGSGRATATRSLKTSMPALRLLEGSAPQSLGLELTIDVRLEQIPSGDLDYYGLVTYGPEQPARSPFVPRSPLYTRFVPERAAVRPASEWCGPDGTALLAGEVSAGLKHIAAQVVRDLDR
jgi:hypothetical protein